MRQRAEDESVLPAPLQNCSCLISACLLALVLTTCPANAQAPTVAKPDTKTLSVATKLAPPFAMRTADGQWSGLAIDLFAEIARDLGFKITWRAASSTPDLLNLAKSGTVDAGIAAVTINAKREQFIDFSHSYYNSGLAIAVTKGHGLSFWACIKALASPAFLGTVGLLAFLLLVTGAVIWFVERHKNTEQFQNEPVEGIGNGFWWAAVTMTTVGYGDKAPITPVGRLIAVVWMFAALILTAVFTAQLTSALTLDQISGPVRSLADLPRARVGIIGKSATRTYFDKSFIRTVSYIDVKSGLAALASGEIDAFVHDEPILRYQVMRRYRGQLDLLPQVFAPQDYGIVLPSGSPLREPVNRALLNVKNSQRWQAIRSKYFGKP